MENIRSIPQFKSYIDLSDYENLKNVFLNNYIAEGTFAKEFCDQLLSLINAKYGCFASNGTLAIYLALKGLGIGLGDEIIVQNSTFIASANAVVMAGAKPIFADIVDYRDYTVDLNRIKLTKKTKGILIAHLFGTVCSNIEEIKKFCQENNLFLIEDAAQAIAIKSNTKHCGTFGNVGTFSFYADKTITTGEGGFVVTNDEKVYENMLYLRNQGRLKSGTFIHPRLGYNFRITDIQAALGLSQLKKLPQIIETKQKIYRLYKELLDGKVEFLKIREDFSFIPFRVVVFIDKAHEIMSFMAAHGVETRSVFYPIHKQTFYQYLKTRDSDMVNSILSYEKGICLPTWVGLLEDDIEYIASVLLDAIKKVHGE